MVPEGRGANEPYAALLAAAVVVAVVLAVYARTLALPPVFDDLSLLAGGGPVRLGGWLPYRPMRYWSYRLDAWWGGGAFEAYHATNIALHAAMGCLVLRLALRLGLSMLAGTLAAVFVVVHPLAVEAVAYVSGRRDLLAACFGLLAIDRWMERPPRAWIALPLVLLSVASKESGLVFAAVCAAVSWSQPAGMERPRALALAATGAAGAALVLAYGGNGAFFAPRVQTLLVGLPAVLAHYASGLLGLRSLSADYPELSRHAVAAAADSIVAGLAAATAVVAATVWAARRLRVCGRGRETLLVCWCALALASVLWAGAVHEPGADRHAYPLLAPLALLAALAWAAMTASGGARSRLRTGIAVALALVLAGASARAAYRRSEAWSNERTLWAATLRARPTSLRARVNLAAVEAEDGHPGRARAHLQRALALAPEYGPAHLGLAALACRAGHEAAATVHLERAACAGEAPARVEGVRALCAVPGR